MPRRLLGFLNKFKRSRSAVGLEDDYSESSRISTADQNVPKTRREPEQRASSESSLQEGRTGLALVHEALLIADGQRNFPIDIVFVHGLNGNIKNTWTCENGVFWPKDLLPAAVPGARIFSYGYDSRVFFSPSTAEYRDFALGLLRDLHYLQQSAMKTNPIVFVCHSLGGIVVKETINVAFEREDNAILNRCRGIVFLSTPHRGSEAAGLGASLGAILSAVWSPGSFVVPGPRDKLIKDLEQNSKVLFGISDRFINRTSSIQITSFYETDLTPPLRKVLVDENSGVLGLKDERRYPMFRNHRNICRFESKDSEHYKIVSSAICETATTILPLREGSVSQHSLTSSEKECIQFLNTVDIIDFEAQIDEHSPRTLLWLANDAHYTRWLRSTSISLLLVTGYAGCGKTVLASYLRKRLPGDYLSSSLVCRFYCNAKDERMHNSVELTRSLILQVVSHSHELLRAVVRASQHNPLLWGNSERLWALFESIATSDKAGELIVIIDAIDELDEKTQRWITSRIVRLSGPEMASSIKFFITSQPQAYAVVGLRDHSLRIALEKKHDLISSDVSIFIHERVKTLGALKGWTPKLQKRLLEVLERRAGQNFLWVTLTLAFVEQQVILHPDDLEKALSNVPPDLTKFYDQRLKVIIHRESSGPTRRLLNMMISSFRPLHIHELEILLSIDKSHRSISEVHQNSAISGVQSIQQTLGPLIQCHRFRIQLVHNSLKDHLKTHGTALSLEERVGHELLAERCIRYLLLHDFSRDSLTTSPSPEPLQSPTASLIIREESLDDDSSSEIQGALFGALFAEPEDLGPHKMNVSVPGHGLYDYAIHFWATHFERCQVLETSPLFNLAEKLYTSFSESHWHDAIQFALKGSGEYPLKPDSLTLACYYGHTTIVQHFLLKQDISDVQIGRALYWSAFTGHTGCSELLYSRIRPDFDRSLCYLAGQSPLAAAAANGRLESVDFLISTNLFGINEQDLKGRPALSLAASRSHRQVVSALLSMERSKGLNVNLVDHSGRSALTWACDSGSWEIVNDLLRDERLLPNLLDFRMRSALSWACEYGLAGLIKLFVANKAVVLGNEDDRGNTPLIYAVKSKDFKTVKNLFGRRGAVASDELNIRAKDLEGRNAISWAASTGDCRILQILLAHSTHEHNETSAQDNNGWPPLAWTFDPPGFPENVMLLIPYCGDNINQEDYQGSSLLSTAISWGQLHIAQLLIENAAIDVNQKNDAGRTALSFAASSGSLDFVKLLVVQGAVPSIADNAGNLPAHWARKKGFAHVAEYLEQI